MERIMYIEKGWHLEIGADKALRGYEHGMDICLPN